MGAGSRDVNLNYYLICPFQSQTCWLILKMEITTCTKASVSIRDNYVKCLPDTQRHPNNNYEDEDVDNN